MVEGAESWLLWDGWIPLENLKEEVVFQLQGAVPRNVKRLLYLVEFLCSVFLIPLCLVQAYTVPLPYSQMSAEVKACAPVQQPVSLQLSGCAGLAVHGVR